MMYLDGEGIVLADAVAPGVDTASASFSHSLIMGALEHLLRTGCGIGGSTSISNYVNCFFVK